MGMNSFIRFYSTNSCVNKSAKIIRKQFVEYFANDLGHSIIRSSPVLPIFDRTVSFINSGMNQFKGVLLDYYDPPATKVVNSQKCIRVSGKHNDLNAVGIDTYHHTFFEMLGNWSFGDYFKEEACRYAWDLLTGPYGIRKEFLYVTYFSGDEKLGLEPDLECRDIWLSLGVSKDRVLPFGMKDNFWEMGVVGPCGPCTEIHIDNTKQLSNQSSKVNQGCADLTELWNIVFMQYDRLPDNSIKPLPKYHVDTGMGLERLVAVLQGKKSNYDTDLFEPLFKKIQKYTNAPKYEGIFSNDEKDIIDRGYRTLADHARMITVALADGILPAKNHKLRRILRKAIGIGRDVFKNENILSELTFVVAESLGEVYPEIENNLEKVQRIIHFEKDLLDTLNNTCGREWEHMVKLQPELERITNWTAPGLIKGYEYLQSTLKDIPATGDNAHKGILSGKVAFKLYDTYGLTPDTIAELAEVERISFDKSSLDEELSKLAYLSKIGVEGKIDIICRESLKLLEKSDIPRTNDSLKYRYIVRQKYYEFPMVKSKLLGLIVNGDLVSNDQGVEIRDVLNKEKNTVALIFDQTPYYSPEGGQVSDKGLIKIKGLIFHMNQVRKVNDWVIHFGHFAKNSIDSELKLKPGDDCEMHIAQEIRIGAMCHHTTVHLLNAALKKIMGVAYQKSSTVTNNMLKFKYDALGGKLTGKQLAELEERINDVIAAGIIVDTKVLNSLELLAMDDVTLIPGEIYPHTGIRLVEICGHKFQSKEACCGTHVHNTKMIQHFCITHHSTESSTCRTIKAVVGSRALLMKCAKVDVSTKVSELESNVQNGSINYGMADTMIKEMRKELQKNTKLSYTTRAEFLEKLKTLSKSVWNKMKALERDSIFAEIQNVISSSRHPFIVHSREMFQYHSLHEVTSLCSTMPIMIIVQDKCVVKAQCSIPEKMVSETFNAPNWIKPVIQVFDGQLIPIKNRDLLLGANMKRKSVPKESMAALTETAIDESTKFAMAHLKNSKIQES